MTPEQQREIALGASIDCLRLAAQSLDQSGYPITAKMLREQARKNEALLSPATA